MWRMLTVLRSMFFAVIRLAMLLVLLNSASLIGTVTPMVMVVVVPMIMSVVGGAAGVLPVDPIRALGAPLALPHGDAGLDLVGRHLLDLQAIGDVLGHGAIGEEAVLGHVAHAAAQVLQVQLVDGVAVQQDAALGGGQ
mgnify:CR=1 FL=1